VTFPQKTRVLRGPRPPASGEFPRESEEEIRSDENTQANDPSIQEIDFAPVTTDDALIRMPEQCRAENGFVRLEML